MNLRSRLAFILALAFALLFAQQGAALHALSHLAEPQPSQSQQDKHLPHSAACEKCVVYAGIGGALAARALCIPPAPALASTFATEAAALLPQTHAHYRPRAPPSLA